MEQSKIIDTLETYHTTCRCGPAHRSYRSIVGALQYMTLIRLQCIYNFLLFHAIILSVLDVLYAFLCYFI